MFSTVKSPSNEIFYNLVENSKESFYLCVCEVARFPYK